MSLLIGSRGRSFLRVGALGMLALLAGCGSGAPTPAPNVHSFGELVDAGGPKYVGKALPLLPGFATCYAAAVTTSGAVAGNCYGPSTGFYWDSARGTVPLPAPAGQDNLVLQVTTMDDTGTIIGYGSSSSPGAAAFVLANIHSAPVLLGQLPGLPFCYPAWTSRGVVVGYCTAPGQANGSAFEWTASSGMTLVDGIAGYEYAKAELVAEDGTIFGVSRSQGATFAAFSITPGGSATALDLGCPSTTGIGFQGINSHNAIVGYCGGSGFLYERGVVTYPFGMPGPVATNAEAINNKGWLVDGQTLQLYEGGTVYDLPGLVDFSESTITGIVNAAAINNSGDIVGQATVSTPGEFPAFLLTAAAP